MRVPANAVVVLAAVIVARSAGAAPPVVPALTLLEPSPKPTSTFGASVGSVGTNVVVGAPTRGGLTPAGPGAAYVFDGVTGALIHSLTAPTPTPDDGFGQAVGALGSDVLVSALHDGPGGASFGAVYLFDGAAGGLVRTFVDPAGDQLFGYTVATLGANVVVGAPAAGRAYLFDGASGTLLHTFDVAGGGWSIAAVGSDVLIGASSSAAYLFDGTTWTLKHIFDNPEPGTDDQFGIRVLAVGTDRVLIANPVKQVLTIDDGLKPGGAAYLFDAVAGTLLHTFHSDEDDYPDGFGGALASLGGDLLIAAPPEYNSAGVVYRFDAASGTLEQEIRPGNPTTFLAGKRFGSAVAVVGDRVAIGAPTERRPVGWGSVYVFDPCGNGIRASGEHCDDGNLTDGDGCSATCRFECPAVPSSTCFTPAFHGSRLRLTQDGSIFETRNKLMWKWRGTESTLADFGDPRASTAYTLCLYDGSGLRMNVAAPAGQTCAGLACWSAAGTTGFQYDDRELTPSGLSKVRLARSGSGLTRIAVTGQGYDLDLPVAGCICPFAVSGQITVQLLNVESGACWESRYPSYSNSEKKLVAKH